MKRFTHNHAEYAKGDMPSKEIIDFENGLPIRKTYYSTYRGNNYTKFWSYEYKYHANGSIKSNVKRSYDISTEGIRKITASSYNENGLLILKQSITGDDDHAYSYSYKSNSNGDWIEKHKTKYVRKKGQKEWRHLDNPVYITKRAITYY